MSIRRTLSVATVLAVSAWNPAWATGPEVYSAWSQITGSAASNAPATGYMDLNLSIRFIASTGDATAACPDYDSRIVVNGVKQLHKLNFTSRQNNPDARYFPLIVCQAQAPANAEQIELIESIANPVPVRFTNSGGKEIILSGAARVGATGAPSFVALGDTGCRGEYNRRGAQQCDPDKQKSTQLTQFRFAEVAAKASSLKPDFVVHLGDYRYDKEQNKTFDMWDSDFFERVRLGLLTELPWAFVRGNHEECTLAGKGWFFFFGPHNGAANCATGSSFVGRTWYFDVAERGKSNSHPHRFVVIDTSATIHNFNGNLRTAAIDQMAHAITAAQKPGWGDGKNASAWFLTHKPLWAADDYYNPPRQADYHTGEVLLNAMKQVSSKSSDYRVCSNYDSTKCGLKAVLSAHLHILQNMVTVNAELPQQFVVGNSGVRMDHAVGPTGCSMKLHPAGFGNSDKTGVILNVRGRQTPIDNGAFGFAHFVRDVNAGQSGWAASAYFLDRKKPTTLPGTKITKTDNPTQCLHL